jgi:hypothetical protein
MRSDSTYQEINQLCHDAGVPAVLAVRATLLPNRADWQRSEGEPYHHYLDVVEAITQILEGWNGDEEHRSFALI